MQRHNNLEFVIDGHGNITSRRRSGNRQKKPHPLADKIEIVTDESGMVIKKCPTYSAYGVWPQGSAK